VADVRSSLKIQIERLPNKPKLVLNAGIMSKSAIELRLRSPDGMSANTIIAVKYISTAQQIILADMLKERP
jgi:hypothetical protein